MHVKFTHPVIVGGTDGGGNPRFELCRMESEFEVPEYTREEAPFAIVTSGVGKPSEYVHTLDGKFYKASPDGRNGGRFDEGGLLSYYLHNGNSDHVQFEPFHQTVNYAKHDLERDGGYQVNVRRELLKKEQKAGMREVAKACMKAPMLRKWSWLSADVDEQIAKWREIAAEKIANIVIIDGVPSIRCFEPGYVLTNKYGAAQIQVSTKHVYQYQVHRSEKLDNGLELLGPGAGEYGTHYFSATQYEDAVAFARLIGWELVPSTRPLIRVLDEQHIVSDDFHALETVRHARMLLSAADRITLQEDKRAKAGEEPIPDPLAGEFVAGSEALMHEVLAWQEQRDDVERVREKVATLGELAGRCQFTSIFHGRAKANPVSDEFKKQLEQFIARDDEAEVSLDIPLHRPMSA